MDQTASVDSAGTIHYKANDHPEAQKTTLAGGLECGCSSGVEHNLAKVGVVGSNPIARSNISNSSNGHRSGPPLLLSAECPRNLFPGRSGQDSRDLKSNNSNSSTS